MAFGNGLIEKQKTKMRSVVMKATGNIRKIDELVSDALRVYDNERKDRVEIFTEGHAINLRKFAPLCVICNAAKSTIEYKGKLICQDCIEEIKEIEGQ